MTDDRDLTTLLRRGMFSHATTIGDAGPLAERIIAAAAIDGSVVAFAPADRPGRRVPRLQPWLLPLVAAVGIAVLVGSVVIGVRLLAGRGSPPAGQLPAPVVSTGPTVPTPSAGPSTGRSTAPSASSSPTPGTGSPPVGAVAAGFRAYDLTWISPAEGWSLGTAPCSSGRCTQLARTLDGGHSWSAMPALPAAMQHDIVDCNAQCVSNLRFADAQTGYAYGIAMLYLTQDGGASWQAQPLPTGAGASGTAQLLGLEIGNGSVLRLTTGCRPGCPLEVQRAAVGGSSWVTVTTLDSSPTADGQLVRAGNTVVVRASGNAAGGAGRATSTLAISTDGGTTWRTVSEPCPQQPPTATDAGEVDTRDVSVAADGTIALLCVPRQGGSGTTVVLSSGNGGTSFAALAASPGPGTAQHLVAASAGTLLVSVNALQRTADRGASWQRVLGPVSYLGFESAYVGRALTGGTANDPGSAAVWTTTDGGATWTSFTFTG